MCACALAGLQVKTLSGDTGVAEQSRGRARSERSLCVSTGI